MQPKTPALEIPKPDQDDPLLREVAVKIPGSGRPAVLIVLADMTDSEWFALVGMLPGIRDRLRRETRTGLVTVAHLPGRTS